MPDVGEVRYKARVDTGAVDEDAKKAEKAVKKSAQNVEKATETTGKKVKSVSDDAAKSVEKSSNKAKTSATTAAASAKQSVQTSANEAKGSVENAADGIKNAAADAASKVEDQAESTGEKVREESQKTKDQTEKDSEQSSKKFALNWSSAGTTAAKAIGATAVAVGAAAVGGIAALGKMGVEYNAQMEQYRTAFTTMLDDAEKADALTESLKDLAAATPMAMTDLADASKTLLAFGSSAEDLPDQLKRLGDVAQGDAQKLGTMATAFGRIQSNGRASMEEINMMIDQGFNPLNIIAEQTGETMAEVRQRVSDGGVSFEELSNALKIATSEGGQFYNAMEAQSQTLTGKWSTLQDNFSAFAGEVTDGITPALMEAMDTVTELFEDDTLKGALTDIFDGISQIAVEALPVLVDTIAEMAPVAGEIVETLLPVFLELLQSLLPPLMELIEAILPVLSEVLMVLLPPLMEIIEAVMPVLISLVEALLPVLSTLLDALAPLLDLFLEMLQPILEIISQALEPLIKIIGYLIELALVPLQIMLSETMGAFTAIFNAISDIVITAVDTWIGVFEGLIKFISGVFSGDWEQAWDGITQIFGSIFGGIANLAKIPINFIIDLINGFLSGLNGIRIPDWVPGVGGMSFSIPLIPRLKKGMPFVPKDFFPAYLDYGERVLTKEQNAMLNSIGGFPAVQQAAQEVASGATRGSGISNSTRIEVPVIIDGREVARATAWYMGEQLAWEER